MVSDAAAARIAPLFVPADRPDRFAKAAATAADGITHPIPLRPRAG